MNRSMGTVSLWAANAPDLPSCPDGVVISDFVPMVSIHPLCAVLSSLSPITCRASVRVWPQDVRLRNVVNHCLPGY